MQCRARPTIRQRVVHALRKNMGALFSSSDKSVGTQPVVGSDSRITEADKALLTLKAQRDKLRQYQKQITNVINREVEIARKHLAAGDKRRALLCLRKKKYQEQLLEKTDTQLLNLEQMVNTVEFAVAQKQVIEGIKAGNDVLKQLNDQMKLEDVEKLMEDTADAVAYQEEVSNMLAQQLSPADDDAVNAELDRILEEQTNGLAAQMPDVPSTEPAANEPSATAAAVNATASAEPAAQQQQKRQRQAVPA